MALIKCIECGNEISSHAKFCPICGCPAEVQSKPLISELNDEQEQRSGDRLLNKDRWINVVNLVNNGEVLPAIDEIQTILSTKSISAAMEIYKKIKEIKELPVDFIIEKYPSQKVTPPPPPPPTTRPCKACGKTISVKAEVCPHCGERTGVRVCPKCGSTDVVILDAVSKTVSLALLGPFAINTVRAKYECWTCHFKF